MYYEARALSKLRFDADGAAVNVGVVPGDGQSQTRTLLFGGEIGLKYLLEICAGNARAVIGNGEQDGVVGPRAGLDPNVPLAFEGLTGVLEDVDKNLVEVIALH